MERHHRSTVTYVDPRDGLAVPPLTTAERRWVESLAAVLRRQPERLMLIEIGDALQVLDRDAARTIDLYDGRARQAGIVLADLGADGSFKVTGVSG